jgi:hypothetical protein
VKDRQPKDTEVQRHGYGEHSGEVLFYAPRYIIAYWVVLAHALQVNKAFKWEENKQLGLRSKQFRFCRHSDKPS